MKVDLFIPCFIDQLYPETAVNTLKVLGKAGCDVHYNPKQTCCGQPAFNSGYWEETRILAKKFLNDFPGEKTIVTPSASCSAFVINHYKKLFENDGTMLNECERVSRNIVELSDFLVNKLSVKKLGSHFPHKVTYHDSCSGLREYGLTNEARTLLLQVEGLELIELEENTTCCGFGGTFSVKHTAISTAMVEQKVKNALATGAEYIVSTEASCLLNINAYCQKQQLPIKGIHLADVLATF